MVWAGGAAGTVFTICSRGTGLAGVMAGVTLLIWKAIRSVSSDTPVCLSTKSVAPFWMASFTSEASFDDVNMITGTLEVWRMSAQASGPLILGMRMSRTTRSGSNSGNRMVASWPFRAA